MKQSYVRKRSFGTIDAVIIMDDIANLLDPEMQSFNDKWLFKKTRARALDCRCFRQSFVSIGVKLRSADARLRIFPVTSWLSLPLTRAPRFPRRRFSSYSRPLPPPPECTHAYLEENEDVSHVKSQSYSPTWNVGETLDPYVLRLDRACQDSSIVHRWRSHNNTHPRLTVGSASRFVGISLRVIDVTDADLWKNVRARNSRISHITLVDDDFIIKYLLLL